MNILAKINRAKYQVAEQILDEIYNINKEKESYWWNREDLLNDIISYIKKEHLFKSDYTK